MASYRLYFFDGDRRVSHSLDAEHGSDADAVQWATGHPNAYPTELWQETRRLVRWFDPKPTPG